MSRATTILAVAVLTLVVTVAACGRAGVEAHDPQTTFRYDTFGDEAFWTDTLHMDDVISSTVDPTTALAVGLKDAAYAQRSTTGQYRTTPLRGVATHPPYFHDGSAATLDDVILHYQDVLDLDLGEGERNDLAHYLRSL